MIRVLEWFNWLTTAGFTLLLAPFRSLAPAWPVAFVSLLTALLMLWAYRRVSDQDALGVVRNRLRAHLLALRLFGHDSLVILRVQASVLRDTGVYLRLSLLPVAVMTLPLLVILSQLNLRFSARPLAQGESATVTVRLAVPTDAATAPAIAPSRNLAVETPPVRMPARREISWRIRALAEGDGFLSFQWQGQEYRKRVAVGGRWAPAPRARGATVIDVLTNPAERPLDSALSVRSIEVAYGDLEVRVFGWEADWLVLFLLETLAFALLLKRPLRVEI